MSVGVLGTYDFDLIDPVLQRTYIAAVLRIALARIPIRTGASRGCDQVATRTALEAGGTVTLVLPWAGFEKRWVNQMREKHDARCTLEVFDAETRSTWLQSVRRYRRSGEDLTPTKTKLYARVYGIVAPCEIVMAMPLHAERGGTGQGMRIARALGKVVLDMRKDDDREQLSAWLKGLPTTARHKGA
jgi:hypothetical protein